MDESRPKFDLQDQIMGSSMSGRRAKLFSDWNWVIKFAVLIMLITSIPYFLGFAFEGNEWRFSGFVFGVEDGHSYIAKMLRGSYGEWLFRTPYTVAPQSGVIAFLLYTLIGKIAAPPAIHVKLVLLFHSFRIVAGILSIVSTYEFFAFFLPNRNLCRWGTLLATLGGGLGWLVISLGFDQPFGALPLDFYSPETFGFLELFGLPHLSLARAGIFFCVVLILRIQDGDHESYLRKSVIAGFAWLVVGISQPLSAVLLGLILLLFLTLPLLLSKFARNVDMTSSMQSWRRAWIAVTIAGMIAGPFILYNLIYFSFDPFLRAWTSQNIIRSPHPVHYLLAYGMILPFSIAGIKPVFRLRPLGAWIPVIWMFALPILVYLPHNLQRRFAEGGWVALVCLGMAGLTQSDRLRKTLLVLTPAMLLSSLFLVLGGILAVSNPGIPLFRPAEEIRAYEFLAQNGEVDDAVLTSYETGNVLPAWAPVKVPVGHGPESVDFAQYLNRVEAYYRSDYDLDEQKAFISELDIDYVFWGPSERELGGWMPENADYLSLWYSDDEYEIYKVR